MIAEDKFIRNERLIRERLEAQIELSLEKGNRYIDNELDGGLNILLRPLVKLFYNNIARKSMYDGAKEQIVVVMEGAIELVKNQSMTIMDIVDKYFSRYFDGDQTSRFLKKKHKNYQWIKDNIKKIFQAQLDPVIQLLQCEEDGINTYVELAGAAFENRERAEIATRTHLYRLEESLQKIEEDISILDIPTGKKFLLRILRRGFEESCQEIENELNSLDFHT